MTQLLEIRPATDGDAVALSAFLNWLRPLDRLDRVLLLGAVDRLGRLDGVHALIRVEALAPLRACDRVLGAPTGTRRRRAVASGLIALGAALLRRLSH